jgi:hypothetical protein
MLSFVSHLSFADGEVQHRAFQYEAPAFIKCGKYLKKHSNCLLFQEEFCST